MPLMEEDGLYRAHLIDCFHSLCNPSGCVGYGHVGCVGWVWGEALWLVPECAWGVFLPLLQGLGLKHTCCLLPGWSSTPKSLTRGRREAVQRWPQDPIRSQTSCMWPKLLLKVDIPPELLSAFFLSHSVCVSAHLQIVTHSQQNDMHKGCLLPNNAAAGTPSCCCWTQCPLLFPCCTPPCLCLQPIEAAT